VYRTDRGVIKLFRGDPSERQLSVWQRVICLSHPHLARLLAAGRCGTGLLYVATEYAEEDLAQVLPIRALSIEETRELLDPVVDALAYLHSHGFVHARLKPSNLWVVDGELKLSSDGVVPAGDRPSARKLRTTYDAPETAEGAMTTAADVWSLGVTVVEALTQRRPDVDCGRCELPETMPAWYKELALACLQQDPRERITLAGIRARLDPEGTRRERAKWPVKRTVAVGIAAAVIAGVVLVGRSTEPEGATATTVAQPAGPEHAAAKQPVVDALQPSAHAAMRQPAAETAKPSAFGPARHAAKEPVRVPAPVAAQAPRPVEAAPAPTPVAAQAPQPRTGPVLARVMPADPVHALGTIRGTVRVAVSVEVNAAGNVTGASFASAGPSRYFSARAIEAARRWRFAPAAGAGSRTFTIQFEIRASGATAVAKAAGPVR
jgi:TonB family protein